ncbi:transporter substrate-binding domain-containing diguanylate cyclase [Hungatella hominis]|uniref:Transporter substrate-binding domain-containing protein n=1 Tax=Hungatella hominis TaxID=2763050 RepID=A0ABR7HER9_9FIRM|nr:transporter substrate-binding domain-containing protein [Hungatella hominis]MBC5711655.1 transporter substrate-binding domain-containing protein [Hungatella hominis]
MSDRKWRYKMVIPFAALFCLLLFSFTAGAAENGTRVVRVGYPIQQGFTEIDENGNYSGYTYDYLQEIARYTNWEYEFFTMEGTLDEQLSEMLTMLINGDLDLMGAMNYTDGLAAILDYPEYSYGTAHKTLSVLKDNLEYTEFDYESFDNIRVAVVSYDGKEDEKLNSFAKMNGFHVNQVLCSTSAEQSEQLRSGNVDAMLGMDVALENSELRVISRFDSRPFYFGVTKGNQEVAGALNKAMEIITSTNPYLSAELNKKYFTGDEGLVLSNSELEYIGRKKTIRAGVMLGRAPLQYQAKNGEIRGISIEVLKYIEEQTGLMYEIVPFHNWEEYSRAVEEGTIDMVIGIVDDYEGTGADSCALTLPYLSVSLQLIMNDKVENLAKMSGKRLALQKSLLKDQDTTGEPLYYDSIEECMEAVHKGEADYCYGNSYAVQYYLAAHNYKNLLTFAQSENWTQKYCFGIRRPVDIMLLSIMNKVIRVLPEDRVNHFLYENVYDAGDLTFSEYVMRNPEQSVLYLALFLLAVVTAVFITVEIARRRNMARKALENQRYEQLSELSNEFLYEYNIREGILNLTEQTAGFLGCERKIQNPETMKQKFPVFSYMISQEENNTEHECLLPGGNVRWLKVISKMVLDTTGRPWYAVGKLIDIQMEREIKDQLEAKAQRDSLTGVYNSATSHQLMRQVLVEEDRNGAGAMIIMDIDYFKQINDYLGHYTGDQVLEETAEILQACFRTEDIVGRLGGDEFVVFMKAVSDPEIVKQRCTEVLDRVKEVTMEKHGKEVTLSIGAAMAGGEKDYDVLYRKADQALYQIKKHGRSGVLVVE